MEALREFGSFRDPSGYVFTRGGEIFRSVSPCAVNRVTKLFDSGVISRLVQRDALIGCELLDRQEWFQELAGPRGEMASLVMRHPKLDFITYPYEWTFLQLRDAALSHLDLLTEALDLGWTLCDSSAYNVQFIRGRPIHIDALSLVEYSEGDYWTGYAQFCRHFLFPLLLESWGGVPFNSLYRGEVDGIPVEMAYKVVPRSRSWLSLNGLVHLVAQNRISRSRKSTDALGTPSARENRALSRKRFFLLLTELKHWIASLESNRDQSYWADYNSCNSYARSEKEVKLSIVRDWVSRECSEGRIWDLGGNSGDFAIAAVSGGAKSVVVIDSDLDSLDVVYKLAKEYPLQPVVMDLSNPSPQQGWAQLERSGLRDRSKPDGVISLALIHHLAIGRNIPLREVLFWLSSHSRRGLIEFVPKSDPMCQVLLRSREDIFDDYSEEIFIDFFKTRGRISELMRFETSGRALYSYEIKS